MKRDWELIKQQLTDIEAETNLFSQLQTCPEWGEISEKEYKKIHDAYIEHNSKILGHIELLVNAGYIDGVNIIRSTDGEMYYAENYPRLTMEGHDLLNTMRSNTMWEKNKIISKRQGL